MARSAATALGTLGTTDLRLVAPQALLPEEAEFRGAQRFTRIEDGIAGADVVMMLRIQKERMAQAASLDDAAYFRDFGLTPQRLKLAAPSVLVMHPGPMNRGVEISSEVADGPRSVIREQVNNGVAVRMAVLASIAATLTRHRRPLRVARLKRQPRLSHARLLQRPRGGETKILAPGRADELDPHRQTAALQACISIAGPKRRRAYRQADAGDGLREQPQTGPCRYAAAVDNEGFGADEWRDHRGGGGKQQIEAIEQPERSR